LLHELEADTAGGGDERDAPAAERSFDDLGAPHDVVAHELGIEIVGEQGRMEEALVG
jgi:hypothetical protein